MDYSKLKVGDKIKLTGYSWDSWKSDGLNTGDEVTIATLSTEGFFGPLGGVDVTFEEFKRPDGRDFALVNLGNGDYAWSVELVQ